MTFGIITTVHLLSIASQIILAVALALGWHIFRKKGYRLVLFVLLLLVGLYLPSSISGIPSRALLAAGYALSLLASFVLVKGKHAPRELFPVLALIPALVWFFTYTSGLTTYALGSLLPFTCVSALLLVRIEPAFPSKWATRAFILCNFVNTGLGIGMITGVANGIIGNWYAFIDQDFVAQRMLDAHKPVLSFYTHSIAAFMLYLFFYLNLRAFSMLRRKIYVMFAFSYLALILALMSTTSLILFALGSAQLAVELWKSRHRVVLFASILAVALAPRLISTDWQSLADQLSAVKQAEGGFSARYGENSEIAYDFSYLVDHPFSPIGASGRAQIRLGDSGLLDYLLRGSLPLVILIYGGYVLFLKSSLRYRKDFMILLCVTLGFELAASVLTYFRFLLLIPFVCAYLNALPEKPVIRAKKLAWWREVARWSTNKDLEKLQWNS